MPTFEMESWLGRQGLYPVAGVDEAGRGPLAGPVVAAAVILPSVVLATNQGCLPNWLHLVDDSKALTRAQRQTALEQIATHAVGIGSGMATPQEIDSNGIGEATRWAMRRAVDNLPIRPSSLLIDYFHPDHRTWTLKDIAYRKSSLSSRAKLPDCDIPFHALAHGDSLCYSVAAASIVAKVTRDRLMEDADISYPGYGFPRHKGYGTADHLRLLASLGPSPIHRRSFRPLRTVEDAKGRMARLNRNGAC